MACRICIPTRTNVAGFSISKHLQNNDKILKKLDKNLYEDFAYSS